MHERKIYPMSDLEDKKNMEQMKYECELPDDIVFISPEDDIQFKCARCGGCCKHRTGRDSIGLSPLDIYNGAKLLGISTEAFLEDYCDEDMGPYSGYHVVTLKSDYETGKCVFLDEDPDTGLAKCRIHDAKPTICALHPLGYFLATDNDGKDAVRYIMTAPCAESQNGDTIKASEIIGNMKATEEELLIAMKVRTPIARLKPLSDTIAHYSAMLSARLDEKGRKKLAISDRLVQIGNNIHSEFVKAFDGVDPLTCDPAPGYEKEKSSFKAMTPRELTDFVQVLVNSMREVQSMNRYFTYVNYDTSKPFLAQAKMNYDIFSKAIGGIRDICDHIVNLCADNSGKATPEKVRDFLENLPHERILA